MQEGEFRAGSRSEANFAKKAKSPEQIPGLLFKQSYEFYAENEVPQPQPPVAFGFSNVKPEPIMFEV